MIQQKVSSFFNNKKLNKSINPDEAVAYGATIQAAILNDQTDLDVTLVDVIPMTLGYEAMDDSFVRMLRKNSKVPSQRTLTTQAEVRTGTTYVLRVYEGERHLARENLLLGHFSVESKQGEVSQFRIHFEVDTNGILTASMHDQLTNNFGQKKMERSSTSLSKKDIHKMQNDAQMFKESDRKETDRQSKKKKLLTTCVNIQYNMRVGERFALLSENDKAKMEMKCQAATDWVRENPEASSDAFEEKKKTLIKQWTALSQQADVLVSALGESQSDKNVI